MKAKYNDPSTPNPHQDCVPKCLYKEALLALTENPQLKGRGENHINSYK